MKTSPEPVATEPAETTPPPAPKTDPLAAAKSKTREALASTLQIMIRSKVPDADAQRLETESLFETVRTCEFTPELLARAREQIRGVALRLANHSPTGGSNLAEIRGLASTFGKFAEATTN